MNQEDFYNSDDANDTYDKGLRPKTLAEIIGRTAEKKTIKLMVDSANIKQQSLDHILFYGPPGLGKTSMANVIANSLGTKMQITSGPAIEKQGDLAALLNSLEDRSILFIDEIHRLKKNIEEILYPAMEDGFLDIVIGSGGSAKNIRVQLPRFTLIGATTRLSMLSAPLQDRFGVHFHLDFYEIDEISQIVQQKARMMRVKVTQEASDLIAVRSRRTARIAIRILKRACDLLTVEGGEEIDAEIVHELFTMLGLDDYGLDSTNRKYMQLLIETFRSRPVGLSTIAAAMGDEEATIADVIEPYLLREGFIMKTAKGRIPTDKALELLSINTL
jgi:Holliday junction DNA helicase RuvB